MKIERKLNIKNLKIQKIKAFLCLFLIFFIIFCLIILFSFIIVIRFVNSTSKSVSVFAFYVLDTISTAGPLLSFFLFFH